LVGYGKKAFHKPPQALARKRWQKCKKKETLIKLSMKTKLLFTLMLIAVFVENTFSQNYIPMLDNSWIMRTSGWGGSQNSIINPGIDVIIGSYTYKKFVDPTSNTDYFLREDISTKRVYRRIGGVDQLLYDFSLQLSNSITLSNGSTYTVGAITNVNVIGGTRRRISLSNGFLIETWIEGVGSNIHPLRPFFEMPSDPSIRVNCSMQNGVNVYNYGIANGLATPTDCSMLLSIEDIKFADSNINFLPNPFTDKLTISTDINFENSTLKIFNSVGQLVKEINNLYGQTLIIERGNLKSGIYFAQIVQNNKVFKVNKIMVED
jgi:hypothetical protein